MYCIPAINATTTELSLCSFIRARVGKINPSCLVLGLSGGIDSAVAALLCSRADLPVPLRLYWLPYRSSSPRSYTDALAVAAAVDAPLETLNITPVVDAAISNWEVTDKLRIGNLCARARMMALFDASSEHGGVVVGTSNLSERCLGYGTLHGDLACAFNPLGNLLKTELRQLAVHIGVPAGVIEKPPTADLWTDQTDEGELGFSYEMADRVLHLRVRAGLQESEIARIVGEPNTVKAILARVARFEFKSAPTPLGPPPA